MLVYPAVLFPADDDGVFGCAVDDLLINASGASADGAIRDAAAILAELLEGMARNGEPFPDPTPVDDVDTEGGTLVMLTAALPRLAA